MTKSKYWLYHFVFTVGEYPFAHPEILQFKKPVSRAAADVLANKQLEGMFAEWKRVDGLESGIYRLSPWWGSGSSDKIFLRIHWTRRKALNASIVKTLKQSGVPCVIVQI